MHLCLVLSEQDMIGGRSEDFIILVTLFSSYYLFWHVAGTQTMHLGLLNICTLKKTRVELTSVSALVCIGSFLVSRFCRLGFVL